MKVRFIKQDFKQVEKLAGQECWYLRAKISETEDEVLALEVVIGHEPTEEDIAKANAEALEEAGAISVMERRKIVEELKRQLADTDYKVMKNSEWAEKERMDTGSYPNEGYPYDPAELYAERQSIRDQIHQYEN